MPTVDSLLSSGVSSLLLPIVAGVISHFVIRILQHYRSAIGRLAVATLPYGIPVLVGIIVLVMARPAIATFNAVLTGSGFLTGADAELLQAVHGVGQCEHRKPHADAVAELSCKVAGVDAANLYAFPDSNAMSSWFERLTYTAATGACEQGGRDVWSSDGRPAGHLGCVSSSSAKDLRWTADAPRIGGQLESSRLDFAGLLRVWRTLSFDLTPANAALPRTCAPVDTVVWDNQGAGTDRWPSAELHLTNLAPCTTVMVSSSTFSMADGPSCAPQAQKVCVLVWRTDGGGNLDLGGLGVPGTWWGYTSALPRAAVEDKADLYNPRGWFASRNCTTGVGCQSAEVWVVNGSDVTQVILPRP